MKWIFLTICGFLLSCNKSGTKTVSEVNSVSPSNYTTTASGLKYKILKSGTGEPAKAGDEIMLFETTSYRDGTVLYSNENTTSPVKVLIGGNQATLAVDEGLRGMQAGEIKEIIAPADLVKRTGYPPNVSPDSALVIKLILHEILEK
jgi:FKBP-type peptidyl-prolyl cis-trans isomerase